MNNLFTTTLLLFTTIWLVLASWSPSEHETIAANEISNDWVADMGLGELPGHNYYSGSITAAEIRLMALHGIHTIIRLNGDKGNDRGHLSIKQEAKLCASLGISFRYMNIEGQIDKCGQEVAFLMQKGYTLVHCRNGAHRAPCMATFYLKEKKIPQSEIINRVGWTKLVQNPGRYDRYTRVLDI